MATQSYAASVQGVAIRCTRLDANGNLLTGPMDSYTTSAFIRVSFTPEYEDGDEITEKAADGTVCVSYKAPDTLKRVNLELAICDPDPELSALMSGGLLLEQGGQSVGWASAQVGEDPSGNGVAVEAWSRAVQNGKPAGDKPYFHWVFPFVKTRLSGDRVIENGLLATTFEGYGLGNINFRSGIDGSWLFPAAADRPYLYSRSSYAPQGMKGFYTWTPGTVSPTAGVEPGQSYGVPVDSFSSNPTAINVKGGVDPYPYSSAVGEDNILSASDFVDGAKAGAAKWPGSAVTHDVANVPPTPSATGVNPQPSVTYLKRGDKSFVSKDGKTKYAVDGATFTDSEIKAQDAANAAKLAGLGYVASGPSTIDINGGMFFHWDGKTGQWMPGKAPTTP